MAVGSLHSGKLLFMMNGNKRGDDSRRNERIR